MVTFLIAFFETVHGREHSRKVSNIFFGNSFNFWSITLITPSRWCKTPESECERITIDLGFTFDWMESWREFLSQSWSVVHAKTITFKQADENHSNNITLNKNITVFFKPNRLIYQWSCTLRWFLSTALRIATVHGFCVIARANEKEI